MTEANNWIWNMPSRKTNEFWKTLNPQYRHTGVQVCDFGGFSQYAAVYLYMHVTVLAFFPSSCKMR